jgi:glycerol-3-phosphate dehydrogenase (NAD(P)+)
MGKLAILGAGSWGTSLAVVLAPRFASIALWAHEEHLAASIEATRENTAFLPGFRIPDNVAAMHSLEAALKDAGTVLGVMPSRFARSVWSRALPYVTPGARIVSATKGLEQGSLLRISEVIASLGAGKPAVLSGPTFAREVAAGRPTALVVASSDPALASAVQHEFSGPTFRLYTNSDPVGVEIGASLKNVIAIAAGLCHGLELGANSTAALITRGLAEITRLAAALGGQPRTLAGLAGLGDLVLTCTGDLSRNRRVGIELARGRTAAEITGSMAMIAEGVDTAASAVELGRRCQVSLPIATQVDRILRGEIPAAGAVGELMERSLKEE